MYTCIGDTQLQSQQSPGEEDDLAVELEKMLNEYDEEKAAQTEAPEPDAWSWQGCRDDDCSQYQEWQSKHWSSQTWSEWSWDRWDSHSGWPHRSWSHESEMSWKQEDWTKEISRGHSADLQPGLQSAAAGASDAEKMQSMLHRLPTSMDDQVRGPAPMMDQKGDKHGPPTAQRDNPDPKQDPATDPTKQQQQQQPMDTDKPNPKQDPATDPTKQQQQHPMETDKPNAQQDPATDTTKHQQQQQQNASTETAGTPNPEHAGQRGAAHGRARRRMAV